MNTSKTIQDPNLDDFPAFGEELRRAVRWLVVYPTVGLFSIYLAWTMTSELLTFLNQDVLQNSRMVKVIEANTLLLADGNRVSLPFLTRVPGHSPLFQSALIRGVEIDEKGNVFGLLSITASCGNTLQHRSIRRINLSELAAVAEPDCVDGSSIHPEEFAFLRENYRYPFLKATDHIYSCLNHWHDALERGKGAAGV